MTRSRVLVTGVFLTDRENTAAQVVAELDRSERWQVEQRWIAAGRGSVPDDLRRVTVDALQEIPPKFVALNRLLQSVPLDDYAFVLVCDDDIVLPAGFLDAYLDVVCEHDFALGQPARTHGSFIDHAFVEQVDGLIARRTRFVEIGPLFSIRRDAARIMLPFDSSSPMGWGYDFVWPRLLEQAGLAMGIVDATPIAHSLRKPVAYYDHAAADEQMRAYLEAHPHLSRDEAFVVLESYSHTDRRRSRIEPMKVSVIVCTFNRANLLRDTLHAVTTQMFPHGAYDVIVVDNNSSDDTKAVAAEIAAASPVPVRYVFERRQGLSAARNAGVAASDGRIVVFVDDDIEAGPAWLGALVAPFGDERVGCTGGRIRPIWPRQKPTWLTTEWEVYLSITDCATAAATGEFRAPDCPCGVHIAFDKQTLVDVGLFSTDLGRIGSTLRSNEEVSVCRKIEQAGKRIAFAPGAVVGHRIHPDRLTKRWFYRRTYEQGRSDAVLDRGPLGRPYARLRDLAAGMVWPRLQRDADGFDRTCRDHLGMGYLSESIAMAGPSDAPRVRQLRILRTFLAGVLDPAAKAMAERQQHVDAAESLIRERDGWLADRDAHIAERDRHAAELQRLALERHEIIERMTENDRVLTTDRDNWQTLAVARERAIEQQTAVAEHMRDSYRDLETDRDNWRRLAVERQEALQQQTAIIEELTRSRDQQAATIEDANRSLERAEADRQQWEHQAADCERTIARFEGALWHRFGKRLGLVDAPRARNHTTGNPQ